MPLTPINLNHDMNLQLQKAVDQIKSIENTPKPGITFRDITPLLANGQALKTVIDAMATQLAAKNIHPDLIVCPEARGFIFGTALAYRLGIGMIPIRKPGKLPRETVEIDYDLEYGKDTLQIHADAISVGQNVILVDDVLATGGTMNACKHLLTQQGANVLACVFLMTLTDLPGRSLLAPTPIISLVEY